MEGTSFSSCQVVVALLLVQIQLWGCSCKQQYALNVPRVLLPLVPGSGTRSNFTLTSTHGCFTWTSTKPDVASVEAVSEPNGKGGCSSRAIVTAQSTQTMRLSSIIKAEEVGGGIVLRCDVFVDTISRIEITTRTRELLLEEEPERFELQAFDDEGNMFSTLNGHVLDWIFLLDEEATHQQAGPDEILKFIPFEESTYSTHRAIRLLEAQGLQGDTVLVVGVNTGSAKVQVSLVDKIWKDVEPSVVKLLVIENLMLQPSVDVYILPLSYVQYHVERRKHGLTEVVPLPSDQYYLQLTNETVAELDPETSRVTGLVPGYTEVILHNKNMIHTPTASKPTAGIHVIPPHHLGFIIFPDNVWVLETGREYYITVNIFGKNNHKILPTENIVMSTMILELLEVHFSSTNGSYHHVTALHQGSTFIHSTLTSMKHPITDKVYDLPNSVSRKQQLEIYDPIQVQPKHLALLWDPESAFRYQHVLKASGGSGTYIWSCDPEGVVSVSGNGTMETVDKGVALVYAADVKNTVHYNHAEVYVIPPAKMVFLQSPVEAMVGYHLLLPLEVKGYINEEKADLISFLDCENFNIDISLSDPTIFNIYRGRRGQEESIPKGACLVITALAVNPGHTRLTVSYRNERSIYMEATVTIAAYLPLTPVDPKTLAVVALGSSKLFVFEGGPLPWVLDRSKFFKKLKAEEPDKVSMQEWSQFRGNVPQYVYRVTCRELGDQVLSIQVGNDPTRRNQFPAMEGAFSKISCTLPVSMTIHPVLSDMPDCPLYSEDSDQFLQFPVLCGEDLDLEVTMFDAENRPFNNFTSLELLWESSDENFPVTQPSTIDYQGNRAVWTVTLGNQPGTVVVTLKCNRHRESYKNAEMVYFKDPFSPEVTLSVSFLLRHRPSLVPSSLILYNHPNNHAIVSIQDGSKYFRVNSMTTVHSPAEVLYSSDTRDITVIPLSEGRMRVAVVDLCLDVGTVETFTVVVGRIHRVEVMVSDKVQVDNSIIACVQVLNEEGFPFPSSQLKYMNLQPHVRSSYITVHAASRDDVFAIQSNISHSECYTVEGVSVGSAYLVFNATMPGDQVIASQPKEIQVFEALKLEPETITLFPTATFQLRSSGGPKPQTSLIYSVSNDTVAEVSESGLILAKELGTTIVTGKVKVNEPSMDQPISYSQDMVTVQVMKLTGIKIYMEATRLLSGVSVAIYAYGVGGESPFTFTSMHHGIVFQWSVSNMDAVSLSSVYDKAGISVQEEQSFDAVLHTRNPGRGTVTLVANCPPGICVPELATFTDQVQIEVFPPLELYRPLGGHFLLPHNGVAQIVTNRDGISSLSYHLLQGPNGDKNRVVSLGEQGQVRAAAVNGHAVVMVTVSEETLGLNQTLIVHVEVLPVASISISPLSLAQATPNSKYHAFPLGYSAEFIVHLHDSVGRRFDFADVFLSHRLNRLDIVLVSPESGNTTYLIKATKQGHVILKVWLDASPGIADYISIRVGYAIIPSLAVVHLGSVVCFSTHLTEDKPGLWSVGEVSIMQLQANSGVGRTMGVGRTVVYHKVENDVDTYTEITVEKVGQVVFNVTQNELGIFTNGLREAELGDYTLPVHFLLPNREQFSRLHTSPNKECLKLAVGSNKPHLPSEGGVYHTHIQQVPFECQLELKDSAGIDIMAVKFMTAEASFDHYSGESYCKLLPVYKPSSVEALSTRDDLVLSLKVVAFDVSKTYSVASESLVVPFLPAFYLDTQIVLLSAEDTFSEITITGLARQLQALKVSSPYPLSVQRTSSPSPNIVVYRITFLPDSPQLSFINISIIVSSPLAQQEERISVSFIELEEEETCLDLPASMPTGIPTMLTKDKTIPPAPYSSPVYFLVTVLVIILSVLVMCMAVNKSSANTNTGFSSVLPPGSGRSSPNTTTFSPMTTPQQQNFPPSGFQTPSFINQQRITPIPTSPVTGSGVQSTFKQTRYSSSPGQRGLFSQ